MTMFHSLLPMILGRALTGFTAGVASVIVPIYIAEISHEPLRGPLGVIPIIALGIGILTGYLLGFTVPIFMENQTASLGCRLLLAVPAVLNILRVMNLILFFNFETPSYLVQAEQPEEAKESIKLLYNKHFTARLDSIYNEKKFMNEEEETVGIIDLIKPKYRSVFLMALVLSVGQQFIGGDTMLVFSNMIFSKGDLDPNSKVSRILTTFLGVFSIVFSLLVMYLLRHFGRRVLIIYGLIIHIILDLCLAIVVFVDSVANFSVKIIVMIWIGVYSLSIGSLLYLYLAETLPETGISVAILANWIAAFLVTQTFIPLTEWIDYGGLFTAYMVIAIIVASLAYFYLIESKGRTKVEILKLYTGNQETKRILIEPISPVKLFRGYSRTSLDPTPLLRISQLNSADPLSGLPESDGGGLTPAFRLIDPIKLSSEESPHF